MVCINNESETGSVNDSAGWSQGLVLRLPLYESGGFGSECQGGEGGARPRLDRHPGDHDICRVPGRYL